MQPIKLGELRLLARGGQADIYALGSDRILRFPRRPQDYERIRYEFQVLSALGGDDAAPGSRAGGGNRGGDGGDNPAAAVSVPKVFELVEVEGAPSIVMERIDGPSMMDLITKRPTTARKTAAELARLHLQVLAVDAAPNVTDSHDKAVFCIERAGFGDADTRDLMRVLASLPRGASLCHGDFHPGNILQSGGRSVIIDWSSASRGDFHADVAHTYLLLKVVPRVPGVSALVHLIQRRIGRAMAGAYLDAVARHRRIDFPLLAGWLLIMCAQRSWYGLPSEKAVVRELAVLGLEIYRKEGSVNQFFKLV